MSPARDIMAYDQSQNLLLDYGKCRPEKFIPLKQWFSVTNQRGFPGTREVSIYIDKCRKAYFYAFKHGGTVTA